MPLDNGVWLVPSEGTDPLDVILRKTLPSLRSIQCLGSKIGHWLLLPADNAEFERDVLHVCDLILRHDPPLGRIRNEKVVNVASADHFELYDQNLISEYHILLLYIPDTEQGSQANLGTISMNRGSLHKRTSKPSTPRTFQMGYNRGHSNEL